MSIGVQQSSDGEGTMHYMSFDFNKELQNIYKRDMERRKTMEKNTELTEEKIREIIRDEIRKNNINNSKLSRFDIDNSSPVIPARKISNDVYEFYVWRGGVNSVIYEKNPLEALKIRRNDLYAVKEKYENFDHKQCLYTHDENGRIHVLDKDGEYYD